MKIFVLNQTEAEEYVTEKVGDSVEEYGFTAGVNVSASDPETAFEEFNRSAYLEIDGMDEIAQEFDEHLYELDIVKEDYSEGLDELKEASKVLQEKGHEYSTEISAEEEGSTPREAVSKLHGSEVHPFLREEDPEYDSVITYQSGEVPRLEPRIQPTPRTTTKEAREKEKELENLLRQLNI